ncbi:MAG: hypothetical protein K6T81_09520 [Alicyclobacillus macrosporangiidus]|uniref:hypothetical protein n=1 Tax=Alicyclobacillus macrosporangiidus TaxID=392015 RepID=UPI0026EA61CC|nr:hypothetical protein [Alicyclobacillus macrosporangiidus]MCL6598969.1 hypothetical protein [Alicyclobacillus macrosporangiidus]
MKLSKRTLRRYPWLAEIQPDEWDEVFDHRSVPWSQEDDDYLLQWYGRDSVHDLSYALGRTPWSIYERIKQLRDQQQQEA